ncbi:MAG: phage holin family protein [Methyloglobulus sp.]|nr:phage holin family protein [Methyloglobulus sp.]
MDSNTIENELPGQTPMHGNPVNGSSLLEDAHALWHELRGLSHDRFQLAALETQQAGVSLVNMVIVGVLVAGLLCGAWLGLLAAAILGLIENGVMVRSAILLTVVLNLLLALVFCGVIRRKSRYLQFPATLHSLQPMSQGHRDSEKS